MPLYKAFCTVESNLMKKCQTTSFTSICFVQVPLPFATEAEYDVEARETDTHLSAREFYNMYLEARADSVLNARELEAMDFEARDYINYLEARGTTSRTAVDAANVCLIQ
jgi:hypothetical protein